MKTLEIVNTIILTANTMAIMAMSIFAHNKCKNK